MDSGYSQTKGFIRSFRGERYHLEEFWATSIPRGFKELFNHRHSSLRNVVERCFGVLKACFKILVVMELYKTSKQLTIVIACCVVHNFIRMTADDDHLFAHWENEDVRHTTMKVLVGLVRGVEETCGTYQTQPGMRWSSLGETLHNKCGSIEMIRCEWLLESVTSN